MSADEKDRLRKMDAEIRAARSDPIPVGLDPSSDRLVVTPACLQPHEVEALPVEGLPAARKQHLEECGFCRIVVGVADVADVPVRVSAETSSRTKGREAVVGRRPDGAPVANPAGLFAAAARARVNSALVESGVVWMPLWRLCAAAVLLVVGALWLGGFVRDVVDVPQVPAQPSSFVEDLKVRNTAQTLDANRRTLWVNVVQHPASIEGLRPLQHRLREHPKDAATYLKAAKLLIEAPSDDDKFGAFVAARAAKAWALDSSVKAEAGVILKKYAATVIK